MDKKWQGEKNYNKSKICISTNMQWICIALKQMNTAKCKVGFFNAYITESPQVTCTYCLILLNFTIITFKNICDISASLACLKTKMWFRMGLNRNYVTNKADQWQPKKKNFFWLTQPKTHYCIFPGDCSGWTVIISCGRERTKSGSILLSFSWNI